MQAIQQALEASLEDFTVSRSERKELKPLLASAQGNQTKQAKIRQHGEHQQQRIAGELISTGTRPSMASSQIVQSTIY